MECWTFQIAIEYPPVTQSISSDDKDAVHDSTAGAVVTKRRVTHVSEIGRPGHDRYFNRPGMAFMFDWVMFISVKMRNIVTE